MAKNVQLTVDIKGGDSVGKAAEKTKSLRQELKALQTDLQSGNLTGAAFDEGIKKAALMKDQINDVNNRVKALATDGADVALKGFADMATGIVGGFAAAQGAMALFGSENEDLQKTLVKLQGATALLNGIQQVNNTLQGDSAAMVSLNTAKTKILTFVQARYTAAVGASTGAMKVMRIVGASLGIGLIVAALGLLIANFDKVKKVITNLFPNLSKLGSFFKGLIQDFTDFIGITSEAERQFEKNEAASNKLSKEYDKQIEILEAMGGQEEKLYRVRLAKLNQDRLILMQKKMLNKASQEEIDKIDELATAIKVLKITEENRLNDIAKKEQEANEDAIKKRQEDFEKKKAEAIKRGREEIDLEIQNMKDLAEAKAKAEQEIEDKEEQKLIDANKKYSELIEQRRVDGLAEREKEIEDINEKYKLQEEAALNNGILLAEIQTEKDNVLREKRKQFAQEDADLQKEIDLTRLQAIADTAAQAGQLLSQVAGKNKALATTALAVEKGAAIADVIIQGIRERQRINAKYALLPPGTAAPELIASTIRTGLSVASITAAGISGAKSISSGGGGGSVQPPNIRGTQTTNEPQGQNRIPETKVFVTETDIRATTRKVDTIYSQATIR